MTREKHRRWLIELLTDRRGARDYYLGDEDKKVIVEALSQPERPKGRWEESICTNCGKDVYEGLDADIWSAYIPPFCPNCGADMRGEEE